MTKKKGLTEAVKTQLTIRAYNREVGQRRVKRPIAVRVKE